MVTVSLNDIDIQMRPAGYYVRRVGGLFPAAYPPSECPESVLENFGLLGLFTAKVLQDERLVDLPLSSVFIKRLLHDVDGLEIGWSFCGSWFRF